MTTELVTRTGRPGTFPVPFLAAGVAEIPDDVSQFIRDHITSVGQLEVLLLLAADPNRARDAAEVSRELVTTPAAATVWLAGLRLRGLLTTDAGSPLRFAFRPRDGEAAIVADLARLWHERPVSVIALIHSRP